MEAIIIWQIVAAVSANVITVICIRLGIYDWIANRIERKENV